MAWYRGGTVTVQKGSANVVGVGTIWTSQVREGDIFFVSANKTDIYEVASVVDDTHLTLRDPFAGTSASGAAYAVIQNFSNTTNGALAAQYADLLAKSQAREAELQAWLTGTVTGGPNSNGYYPVSDLNGNSVLIPCPALIRPPEDQAIQTADGLFNMVTYDNPGRWQSLDLSAGSVFRVILNQEDTELVFKNANMNTSIAQHFTLVLEQGTGSNKCSGWPASVRWNQGRAPILSYAKGNRDVLDFFSIDGGATWMGFFGGTQIPQ